MSFRAFHYNPPSKNRVRPLLRARPRKEAPVISPHPFVMKLYHRSSCQSRSKRRQAQGKKPESREPREARSSFFAFHRRGRKPAKTANRFTSFLQKLCVESSGTRILSPLPNVPPFSVSKTGRSADPAAPSPSPPEVISGHSAGSKSTLSHKKHVRRMVCPVIFAVEAVCKCYRKGQRRSLPDIGESSIDDASTIASTE